MNKAEINNRVFEIMLKAAVEENFSRELREFPDDKDLTDDYELSLPTRTKIEKMIRESYRRSILLRVGKIAKRAAVVVAIIIPISLGSLLSVEASRNAIFNALLDWQSNHVAIHYQEEGASSGGKTSSSAYSVIKPKYLPDGFAEVQTVKIDSETEIEYRNEQGMKILFSQEPLTEGGNIGVDTEHTTETEIEIQGEKAFLFTADSSEESSYLVWNDHNNSFLLNSKVSPQELIKIAESVQK